MAVLLETTLGDVVIDLYTEERPRGEARAPLTSPPGRYLPSPLCLFCQVPVDWLELLGCWCPRLRCFISGPWLKSFFEEQSFSASGAGSGWRVPVVIKCVCVCVCNAAYTMPIAFVALLLFTSQRNASSIPWCVISIS